MSCCNRSKSNRSIRSQKITKSNVKKQRITRQNKKNVANDNNINIQNVDNSNAVDNLKKIRQKVTVTQKCKSCGHPITKVNIAGRERLQCVNSICRKIIR